MAAINDIGTIGGQLEEELKAQLVQRLWIWIHAHQDDEVLKINWVVIRKTFRIRDLYPVFEVILGPDTSQKPAASVSSARLRP